MDKIKIDFSVDTVKEQIINTTLVIATSLGILAYLLSFYTRYTDSGFNISSLFETITLLSLLIITIRRKYFKTIFKAYTLLFFSIFISLTDTYLFGLMGSVSIYLLLIPLLSVIYFSVLKSVLFFFISISGYIFIGYLHHMGVLQIIAGYEPSIHVLRLSPWIIRAVHITAIGFILLYITLKYFQSFSRLIIDLEHKNKISSDNERNYREIFNSTSEAIFLHNSSDGKIIDVNDVVLRMFGYKSKDEIINHAVEDLSYGDRDELQKRVQTLIHKAVDDGPHVFEWLSKRKNGEVFHSEISLKSTEIGGKGRVLAVIRDISQRKKSEIALRESEEKFRIIFENSPLGIFRFDKEGIINECNLPLTKIIGSPKDEILNLSLFHLPDIRIHGACREVLKGKPAYFEGYYQSFFSDKITPVRFFFAPIISPQSIVEGGICLAEDRTFLLQKEEYRKQAQIAKESVKFKQNFLANMSHEIRTPLTGVLGMIDIMEKTNLSEKQKDYINTLKISGENLKEIINQVLDYSKIEAGKMSLKYSVVELRSLLSGAENLFKNLAKPGVTFSTQMDENIPDLFLADCNRIAQVVNNLVSNALKFTEKGSVKIIATLVAFDNPNNQITLKIEVADTGIGIQESMLDILFTPFSQIDTHENEYREGTGLGLTISRELVKMHGGEMGVESQFKKGSTFWFTFVAKIPNAIDHKPVVKLLNNSTPKRSLRILYAEDKKINQKVVKILLSSLGHKVTIANDGEHAVRLYQPGKFDLILMDIQMPVMDGIKATHELKKNYHSLPPIIGLSANAFEGDREKYMDLGMDEYLTKPMVLDDFIKVVNRVIQ